jgi:hypothetical protein
VNEKGVTVRPSDCVLGAGAPGVFAEIVRLVVDGAGVVCETLMVKVTVTGAPEVGTTFADGKKSQVAPAGSPLQARVTVPLNDPDALTLRVTAFEVLPCAAETLPDEGTPNAKSTTCKVTAASCVICNESAPTPWMLNA